VSLKNTIIATTVGALLAFNVGAADAAQKKRRAKAPTPPAAQAVFVCVVDTSETVPARRCQSLDDDRFNKAVDKKIPPASLTKIPSVYMVYQHMLSKGHKLDDKFVTITAADNAQGRLGERGGRVRDLAGHVYNLQPGTTLTYREAILGMSALSANNVAVAAAKAVAPDGKESTFARMMTDMVHGWGLTDTTFKNASGMPATGQLTTAREMGLLVDHIVTELGPKTFRELYGQTEIIIAGRTERNILPLFRNEELGIVGAKTGYQNNTSNIAFYSERGGVGTVTVVLGSPNGAVRNTVAQNTAARAFALLSSTAHAQTLPPVPPANGNEGKPKHSPEL
jgi:D-alanyl-D-alanine carboxypeptidase